MRRTILSLLLLAAAAATAAPASAQYFGRNKVQYEDFEWRVMKTDHFDLHYYPSQEAAVREAARGAERWNDRLERVFRHRLTERKPIVQYETHPDFQQTNVTQGRIGEGTGGLTDPLRNRATQPFAGTMHESLHVIGHELAHVFQFDIATAEGSFGLQGMYRLPLWLIEGMAEYLSVGRVDPHTAMWLRDAALRGDIPSIEDLTTSRKYFPYRYGQALLAYIGGVWGDVAVTEIYRVGARQGLGPAIRAVTGLTAEQLSDQWAEAIRLEYLPVVAGRVPPEQLGRDIFARDPESGNMNLAPVLSPDGRRVAFLSERGLFSVDLYVADVETGEIVEELTDWRGQPHFDALSYLNTAGTWSPDGRQFAYVVVDEGDNELRIADASTGDELREIEVPGVDGLNDPAWSPDGRRLAFSASSGGISDLYLYELDTNAVTQLTSGLTAEFQPDWSPDGRTLVFVTDRGPETDLRTLTFARPRLATIDVETREVRLLPGFEDAKHINPQFSPDGRDVYFISDRDGISDVFRLELPTRTFHRVTSVATGISGITSLSPALSVSEQTGRVAFSIFKNNRYTLHTLTAEEARGEPVRGGGDLSPAGVLPPVAAADESIVSAYLASPLVGLPIEPDYAVVDYEPDLDLEYVGAPSVGVSSSQFGTGIGGATSLFFGDLLGNRQAAVAVQAQGSLKDLGGQAFYQNLGNRWNWALIGGHIPYLTGQRFRERLGANRFLIRDVLYRQFIDQAAGRIAYPFSTTRRVEATASFTRFSYDIEQRPYLCEGNNCQRIEPGEIDDVGGEPLPFQEPEAVNLGRLTGAFVGDYSIFGFTGPIAGGRYRFEVEPTIGGLQYISALADYRRYLFFDPFTLAGRGLHYGRYGRDAETHRFLAPIFLGSNALIRGYERDSFSIAECGDGGGELACPAFDRLVGSRIAVASFELRVPLLGVPEFGLIEFPFLPTDAGAFLDAGLAWGEGDSPELSFARESDERIPVASAGLFARSNILGYVILESWLAYPFQRPGVGWQTGFTLRPGW